jgi:hypothetical protein
MNQGGLGEDMVQLYRLKVERGECAEKPGVEGDGDEEFGQRNESGKRKKMERVRVGFKEISPAMARRSRNLAVYFEKTDQCGRNQALFGVGCCKEIIMFHEFWKKLFIPKLGACVGTKMLQM